MRIFSVLALAALLIVGAAAEGPLGGLDLTGTWTGYIPGKGRRQSTDIAFQFIQEGSKLTGKLYGDGQSSPILSGRIDELGNIRFLVETREQGGNQINDTRYYFEGVICDGVFEMTRERIFSQDAITGAIIPITRPNDTPDKNYDRRFMSFVLERAY